MDFLRRLFGLKKSSSLKVTVETDMVFLGLPGKFGGIKKLLEQRIESGSPTTILVAHFKSTLVELLMVSISNGSFVDRPVGVISVTTVSSMKMDSAHQLRARTRARIHETPKLRYRYGRHVAVQFHSDPRA